MGSSTGRKIPESRDRECACDGDSKEVSTKSKRALVPTSYFIFGFDRKIELIPGTNSHYLKPSAF